MYSAAMAFAVLAVYLRSAKTALGWLDAMRSSAYGIYLLHYIVIIWLQYAVYDYSLPAFVKFMVVIIETLSGSWALAVLLRKIAIIARMI
jgi:surface polysaccharide O-acyltransferase-like enzyme